MDVNNFSQAALYAADNDIEVVEGAVGGLFNSRFGRAAFADAYRKGVFLAIVSSDLNTADHNIPTVYDEAMQVQGSVADVEGLGQSSAESRRLPRRPRDPDVGADRHLVPQLGHDAVRRPRAHRHAGGHRLRRPRARPRAPRAWWPRSGARRPGRAARAERDQAAAHAHGGGRCARRTRSARRARPRAGGLGPALRLRPARPRAGARADRPGQDPAAGADHGPDWFAPLNLAAAGVGADQRPALGQARGRLHLQASVGAGDRAGRGRLPGRRARRAPRPRSTARSARSTWTPCAPRSTRAPAAAPPPIPTAPAKGPGDKDPNEPAFTVRVVVTDTAGNRGEDRKVLFAYRDTTLHDGWSRSTRQRRRGVTAAVRPQRRQPARHRPGGLERRAERAEGRRDAAARASTAASRSGRRSTRTSTRARPPTRRSPRRARSCARRRSGTSTATSSRRSWTPRASTCTPGTATAAWSRASRSGSTRRSRAPALRTRENHVKRGFIASPTLGDLDAAAPPSRSSCPRSTSTSTPGTARAPRCRASRAS